MAEEPFIEVKDMNVYYNKGKPNEFHALHDINLKIMNGEYVAFFGPSGSGKTTLLYAIAGIDRPQEGQVLVRGRDIAKSSEEELAIYRQLGVGIIFQQFNLIPSLTVSANVALPMSLLGVGPKRREEEALKILDRLGIKNLAERYPFQLSGGQQQRVGIARALANNAPLIIADEPLGNLDSENANKALDFLKDLHEKDKRTIIIVTHEEWSLRDVERVYHLKDGVITHVEDRTEELKKRAEKPGAEERGTTGDTATEEGAARGLPIQTPYSTMADSLGHIFLRGHSQDEIQRLSKFIDQRLAGKLTPQEFFKVLDEPYKDGGVGLWKQRATKITKTIEEIIAKKKDVREIYRILSKKPEKPLESEVETIRQWLLKDYGGKVTALKQDRLDEVVRNRIRKIITDEHAKKILRLPEKQAGAGFSMRATQEIMDKLESIL